MKIRKGDEVQIVSGNDKGKRGKVRSVFPELGRIVVEGVNVRRKHVRSRQQGKKGEVVQLPMPIHASRVQIFCAACSRGVRAGSKREGGSKIRVCKRCGAAV